MRWEARRNMWSAPGGSVLGVWLVLGCFSDRQLAEVSQTVNQPFFFVECS